jgi:hypothetical protein
MSWDVSIINFARSYTSVDEIPDDENPLPLGAVSRIHTAVTELSLALTGAILLGEYLNRRLVRSN